MFELATAAMMLGSGEEVAIPILAIIGGTIVLIVMIGVSARRRSQEAGYTARLKQMMIERGMTADEIERVIKADPGGRHSERRCN